MKKDTILIYTLLLLLLPFGLQGAEVPLIANIYERDHITLNGKWNYVVDPLENGYYDYRRNVLGHNGFFENRKPANQSELVEYNLDTSPIMSIPSDWNSADSRLFFYEGTVWFKKDFELSNKDDKRYILYFGAVNYDAKVYVNGAKVGEHVGGYTPFNFDITDNIKEGYNFIVIKVDNKRAQDNVPTVHMDWWNYGGITREVLLATLPTTYLEDYSVGLSDDTKEITGWVAFSKTVAGQSVVMEIPELKIKLNLKSDTLGRASYSVKAKPELWSPEKPKLYDVKIVCQEEIINDKIGFRTISTQGKSILLNGKRVFLRGVSIHEEAPFRSGRAWSREDAHTLLSWAKEMGCNYVRLAHYPHNEYMVREAERMGIMIWSEIPVYWTISWDNAGTYGNAERQLHDMIRRDRNRCAVVIWSIANETPHSRERDQFLSRLSSYARGMDNTRLISMAMEMHADSGNKTLHVKDNMNEYVDIISFNQYMGWYWGDPEFWRNGNWNIPYDKPVMVSEFGGGCLQGFHGDKNTRFTEENQEYIYQRNLEMLERIDGLAGLSPWILVDFRSPRRQIPNIQDFYNRKGLISDSGNRKKAFYVMQSYYKAKADEYR